MQHAGGDGTRICHCTQRQTWWKTKEQTANSAHISSPTLGTGGSFRNLFTRMYWVGILPHCMESKCQENTGSSHHVLRGIKLLVHGDWPSHLLSGLPKMKYLEKHFQGSHRSLALRDGKTCDVEKRLHGQLSLGNAVFQRCMGVFLQLWASQS